MPTVMVADFSGMLPLRDPILLPDNNAQYANNTWLYVGKIRGFRHGNPVHVLQYADTKLAYRIPLTNINPPDFSDTGSLWLEYPDPFMATIRNPTVGDQWDRYYFFPSDQIDAVDNTHWRGGPQYATVDMLRAGDPPYVLGIPPATNAPTVTPPTMEEIYSATAITPVGGTVLQLNSTAGVIAGMLVYDATDTSLVAQASVVAAAGTTTLTFPSTTGILAGMKCKNLSNPASIFTGATAVNVTATTVVINFNLIDPVQIGDSIQFDNVYQIPANTTVKSVDSGVQVTMSAGATAAGVQVGDVIQFDTDVPETRAYLYTWISAFNEEGPPSPATVATGDPTGMWTVYVPALETAISDNRNIVSFRLYRTVTDSQGNASYYQVGPDYPHLDGYTVYDSALAKDITGAKSLDTVSFTPPPADLQGVVMMANGIAAGWSNQREVWFSAAYQPHAWPAVYALTVDYPIVGMTADGSSLNIVTEGAPFLATGVTPDTMTMVKITANEPCIGRGSIISAGEGAYYASPNGYQLLNSSGTTNVTLQLFEKEFWYGLTPYNFCAGKYGASIVAFIKGSVSNSRNGVVVDFNDKNTPLTYINTMGPMVNALTDELSGQVFYITTNPQAGGQGAVVQWNPPIPSPNTTTLWNYTWKSKKFRFTTPQQLAAFLVYFQVPPEVTFTLGSRNTDQAQVFDPNSQYLIVRVYADEREIVVREVQVSGEVLKIPGGFKAIFWEFQLEGIVEVNFFKSASSVKELKAG